MTLCGDAERIVSAATVKVIKELVCWTNGMLSSITRIGCSHAVNNVQ